MGEPLRIRLTYEDYKDMPEDGRRYEIVDGELAVSPAPTVEHQRIVARLYDLFIAWVRAGAGGEVFFAPLTVLLAEDTVLEPDLFWISGQRVATLAREIIRGGPDLVVEVMSPSTAKRDRTTKASIYSRYGVREYWLVDPVAQAVTILALDGRDFRIHASGTGDQPLSSSIDAALKVVPSHLFAA